MFYDLKDNFTTLSVVLNKQGACHSPLNGLTHLGVQIAQKGKEKEQKEQQIKTSEKDPNKNDLEIDNHKQGTRDIDSNINKLKEDKKKFEEELAELNGPSHE
ncbi:hypothetical protein RUM44_011514 [Polyplax serrata]|uniref:Uncharacterized protein n=1 Tax=Polyplax serrata TaxID=468196 RepID=A0ABR1AQ79_POLSC